MAENRLIQGLSGREALFCFGYIVVIAAVVTVIFHIDDPNLDFYYAAGGLVVALAFYFYQCMS